MSFARGSAPKRSSLARPDNGRCGLAGNPRVVRLHIPDCFLQDLQNECA